jgi:hypothetical protein
MAADMLQDCDRADLELRARHASIVGAFPLTRPPAFSKDVRLKRAAWRRRRQEERVLVDHRYYHIKPGMVGAHLDLYEKNGFAAQTRHLGQPLAYMYTESGEVNTLVHIWCYEDAADRAKKRADMWKDPQWQGYAKQMADSGYLVAQRNNLMIPAKFAPIKR